MPAVCDICDARPAVSRATVNDAANDSKETR
ncbi:hypothetical protein BUUB107078_10355 [Burkholderia ubonensis]|nr:hypothetical protein BUB20358_00896 [Burkholderia ubonensis]